MMLNISNGLNVRSLLSAYFVGKAGRKDRKGYYMRFSTENMGGEKARTRSTAT